MKRIILILALLICVTGVFAQKGIYDAYKLRSRYEAKVDSVLILNSTNVQIDTSTLVSGQFFQYDGQKFTNKTVPVGIDSITNTGDGWLRVYYGGNVVDSALLTQFIVSHDATLIGDGTPESLLQVDTSAIALKDWVTNLVITSNGYTDEQAQDAVGSILDDGTLNDILFNYNDATPKISASVKDDSHNHVISNVDNLQDSLNAKQDVITGAATTVTENNLNVNRALISNGSGKIAASTVISATELNYLDNARSNIQTQIDSIAGSNQDLSYSRYADKGIMNISDGTGDTIHIVDSVYAGLMTPEDKSKLDTITSHPPVTIAEASADLASITDEQVLTVDIYQNNQQLNYNDNVTIDFNNGNNGILLLTGDVSLLTFANVPDGGFGSIVVIQDGTGGWSINGLGSDTVTVDVMEEQPSAIDTSWNYNVQILSGTTDTLNVDLGLNGYWDISANSTLRFANLHAGMTGNITILCDAGGYTLTFAGYELSVSPAIDGGTAAITTSAVAGAQDTYSYYYDGVRLTINGTKEYKQYAAQ